MKGSRPGNTEKRPSSWSFLLEAHLSRSGFRGGGRCFLLPGAPGRLGDQALFDGDYNRALQEYQQALSAATDDPTRELAMEISQRRAQNVVNYLVGNFGIARSRLSAEGFGTSRRFAYNTSVEGEQENRRVNIIINYPKK